MLVLLVILVLAIALVLLMPGRAVDVGAKVGGIAFILWILIVIARFLLAGTTISLP